jgi:hypothetical protein
VEKEKELERERRGVALRFVSETISFQENLLVIATKILQIFTHSGSNLH